MSKFLVTHLILTYNDWDYLNRAIYLSCNQKGFSKKQKEILIIDDGSHDPIEPKLKKIYGFKNQNIRVIRNKKNKGILESINIGLKNVRSPYVHLGSSNDIIKENFFSETVEALELYKQASFVFSDPGEFDENRNMYREFPLFLSKKEKFFTPSDFTQLYKKFPFHIGSNTILFRTSFLKKVGIQKDLPFYGDWFLSYFLSFSQGCCYIPRNLTYYTVHEKSFSSSCTRKNLRREIPLFLKKFIERNLFAFDNLKKSDFLSAFPFFVLFPLLFSDPVVRKSMTFSSFKKLVLRSLWHQIYRLAPSGFRKIRDWIIPYIKFKGLTPNNTP